MTRRAAQPPVQSAAWQVIGALVLEVKRQAQLGAIHCSKLDEQARIRVEGTLDLASLASAAENGLRAAFMEGIDDA